MDHQGLEGIDRLWLAVAAINGAVAVGMGAYASHGLAGDARAQELVRMASDYQLWHALALIAAAVLANRVVGVARLVLRLSGWLFVFGLLLFCGALYITGLGRTPPVAMMAPTGGTCFMLGWGMMAIAALLGGRRAWS